jgi:spore coat polysaccharide biosynthesis predicted glycosyltransferase SpsG
MHAANILFKVAGGENVGMGHVIRSTWLAKEFQKDPTSQVYFYSNPNRKTVKLIKEMGFELHAPKSERQVDENLLRIVEKKGIDILVVDQPKADTDFKALKIRKPKLLIVALDYFDYLNKNVDIVINLFNQNIRIDPRKIIRRYYEGVKYAIIRDSFSGYAKKKKRIKKDVKDVLITFGSADPNFNTEKILSLLEKLDNSFEVHVVVGPAFKRKNEVIKKIRRQNYKVHQNVFNLEKLIFSADLGFSGAGTTLLEFCVLGTPLIVFPQNENEKRFAEYFEKRNAVTVLHKNLSDRDKIRKIQEIIGSQRIRKIMSKNQKKLIDLDGNKRIKRTILENYWSRKP